MAEIFNALLLFLRRSGSLTQDIDSHQYRKSQWQSTTALYAPRGKHVYAYLSLQQIVEQINPGGHTVERLFLSVFSFHPPSYFSNNSHQRQNNSDTLLEFTIIDVFSNLDCGSVH